MQYLPTVLREMFQSAVCILCLLATLVPPNLLMPCFDSVTLTVYRSNRKIVLQRADTVKDEIFATEISAENQHIPLLQTGCFRNLPMLQYITVTQCGLHRIEPSAFYNLPNLRAISLSFNNLQEIRNGIFHSLEIVKLRLIANGIEYIQQHAFYNLTSLEILDLSHNNLFTLKSDIFFNTNNLRQINLSHNKLLYIEDYFFWTAFGTNLDTVTALIDLSYNNLSTIERNTFKGVYYIHSLLLNDNRIKNLSPNAFSHLRYGKSLDLRDNRLEGVPLSISQQTFEQVLYDKDNSKEEFADTDTFTTNLPLQEFAENSTPPVTTETTISVSQ